MAKKRRGKGKGLAAKADKYDLYLKSVQAPDVDVLFFVRAFKHAYGRAPVLLREDFCGTAAVCYEWAKSKKERRAIGVDIDPEPLEWGVKHLRGKLKPKVADRVELIQDDVRVVQGPKADVVSAQNFSYLCFKTREALRGYFESAYANLAPEGVLVLDLMGGPEVIEEGHVEETKHGKFTYLWDQARFDPITHDCKFHIHFRFKDGSKKRRAFTYEWRLWTIPEVSELVAEAGFKKVDVYWEDTDTDTGEGTGTYRRRKSAESDTAWVAYIVGTK